MKKQPAGGRQRRLTPEQRTQRISQVIFGILAVVIILSMVVSLIRY